MQTINTARLLGRIDGIPGWLMMKYQLQLTQEVKDTKVLLIALSQKLPEPDSTACLNLAVEYNKLEQELQTQTLNEYEVLTEKQKGVREANYLYRRHAHDYDKYLMMQHDFIADEEEEEAKRKAKTKKIMIAVCSVLVIVFGSIIIYNLPYFEEKRLYSAVQKDYPEEFEEIQAISAYKAAFPEGKHIEDVLYRELKFRQKGEYPDLIMDAAEEYLNKFPNGTHAAECKEIINAVWDKEISLYETLAKDAATPAKEYVIDMLKYMKANNIRTVNVDIKPILKLKEYSEYPEKVRMLMEAVQNRSDGPKLPSAMISIKDKITESKASGWGSYIVEALQDGFNRVLTKDFIKFVAIEDGTETDKKAPVVNVSYTVQTQEFQPGFPDIWTYTEKQNFTVVSESLLLGISMHFDAEFSIPGSKDKYSITGEGNPGDQEISGEPSTGYSVMCERCTLQFAEKIATTFGLNSEEATEARGIIPEE